MQTIEGKIKDVKINEANHLHAFGVDVGEGQLFYVSVFIDPDKGMGRDFVDSIKTLAVGDVAKFSVIPSTSQKTGQTFYNIRGVDILTKAEISQPAVYVPSPQKTQGEQRELPVKENRDVLIIRQVTAKCAARIMSAVIGFQGLDGVGTEDYIIIAKRLEQYILTGD